VPAQAREVTYPMAVVGFWERVLAGNIDAPGSEAYNRWGDGFLQGIAASDRKFSR
jgi:hypothetical protein